MKREGFTLIELLAVIVILAIIALIATPIILNIINDAKKESNERSIEMYASAVKNAVAIYQLKEGKAPTTFEDLEEYITYDGTEVKCETSELNNDGSIYLASCKVGTTTVEGYTYGTKQEDEVIKLCTANTTKAKALVWQGSSDPAQETSYAEEEVGLLASESGAYTPGVAYTCNFIDNDEANDMIFFVLSSTENDVTLISGANLDGAVAWSEDGSNYKDELEDKQAVTAKAALTDRTSNWLSENGGKLNETQSATIKLPTANQIAEAAGKTFTGSNISELPTWLDSFTSTPVAYGYWTSSPFADNSNSAWIVSYYGIAGNGVVNVDNHHGVRPVITISKSKLS